MSKGDCRGSADFQLCSACRVCACNSVCASAVVNVCDAAHSPWWDFKPQIIGMGQYSMFGNMPFFSRKQLGAGLSSLVASGFWHLAGWYTRWTSAGLRWFPLWIPPCVSVVYHGQTPYSSDPSPHSNHSSSRVPGPWQSSLGGDTVECGGHSLRLSYRWVMFKIHQNPQDILHRFVLH